MMARVNVSIKDEWLILIDEEAKMQGTDRRAIIESALERYIEAKRRRAGQTETGEKMQEASRKMDMLAKKLGKWDPQAIIRKFRDSNLKGGL